MITLFRLKQNGTFRTFYHTPYYIKNICSLIAQVIILFIIFLAYFRSNGTNIGHVTKILNGLESSTFNFLEEHKHQLKVDYASVFEFNKGQKVESKSFFSEFVRMNRPCTFKQLARDWPLVKNNLSLSEIVGNETLLEMYLRSDSEMKNLNFLQEGYSFKEKSKIQGTYSEFQRMAVAENYPGEVVLRDTCVNPWFYDRLLEQIEPPSFYTEHTKLRGLELIQGSHFISKPKYEKQEQIMCTVDGRMNVVLVPHINRQEVYAGKNLTDSAYDEGQGHPLSYANVSPVNFFMPNKQSGKFSLFSNAQRRIVNMEKGDCIFIPAYYFFQYQGVNLGKEYQGYADQFDFAQEFDEVQGEGKKMATAVSMKFKGNSKLLEDFMDSVEKNHVK